MEAIRYGHRKTMMVSRPSLREGGREGGRESECVCVCVREREGERCTHTFMCR